FNCGVALAGYKNGNQPAQVRFVADEQDTLRFFVVQFADKFECIAIWHEKLGECYVFVEFCCDDLGCLQCAHIRAGENQIELDIHCQNRLGDLMHFLFTLVGQRPVTIFLIAGRSSIDSNTVAENVDFHYSLLLSESAIFLIERTACSIFRRSFLRPFSGFKLISSSVSFMPGSLAFLAREFGCFPTVWFSLRNSIISTISRCRLAT